MVEECRMREEISRECVGGIEIVHVYRLPKRSEVGDLEALAYGRDHAWVEGVFGENSDGFQENWWELLWEISCIFEEKSSYS